MVDIIEKRIGRAQRELNLALQVEQAPRVVNAIRRALQSITGVQNSRLFERQRQWRREQRRQTKQTKHRRASRPDVPVVPAESG